MAEQATGARARDSILPIMIACAVTLALAFGLRQVFGVFMKPISNDLFAGEIGVFSLSLAVQNLVWGLAQPGFGALADKFGARIALALGLALYVVGVIGTAFATTAAEMHVAAGLFVGAGIAGTAFGLVLSVVGRASRPEKRSQNLGLVSAFGSGGQVLVPLIAGELITEFEWRDAVLYCAILLTPIALCIPFMKARPPKAGGAAPQRWALDEMPLGRAVCCAFQSPNYVLLTLGFFVCGFHIAFITAHLPNFVENFCTGTTMSPDELRGFGLQALGFVGLANIVGTLLAGQLGAIFPKQYVLATIYALRAVVIVIFISVDVTPTTVTIFAAVMGLLWLSTVPLTSGMVFGMFGPRYSGTLYGFVFLSHQIGSFLGVWLGGVFFDAYRNYDMIWHASIVLGIVSAIVHLPVRERPFEPRSA